MNEWIRTIAIILVLWVLFLAVMAGIEWREKHPITKQEIEMMESQTSGPGL